MKISKSVDDEWEYEYDDTETEDYYVTLDLSSVSAAVQPTADAVQSQAHSPIDDESEAPAGTPGDSSAQLEDQSSKREDEAHEELQILDLHGPNPLVSYRGKLLSCHWATSLGTDLFFAHNSTSAALNQPPLRALSTFDLLGAGSARLIAADVDLVPRDIPPQTDTITASSNAQRPIAKIPVGDTASTHERNQARFLERLDALKARRGEEDSVLANRGGFRPAVGVRPIAIQSLPRTPGSAAALAALVASRDVGNDDADADLHHGRDTEAEANADEDDPSTWSPDNIARRKRPSRRTKAALFGVSNSHFRQELQGALAGRSVVPVRTSTTRVIRRSGAGVEKVIETGEDVEMGDEDAEGDVDMDE